MFYYCLTLLGCDVLVVENKKDAEIDEGLKQLSGTVRLGDYGTAETEAYVPPDLHIHMAPEEEEALQYEANIKITLPERLLLYYIFGNDFDTAPFIPPLKGTVHKAVQPV